MRCSGVCFFEGISRYSPIFSMSVCRAGSISAKVYWSRFALAVRPSSVMAEELSTLKSGTSLAMSGRNQLISSHSVALSFTGLPPSLTMGFCAAGSVTGLPSISPFSVSQMLRRARKRSSR